MKPLVFLLLPALAAALPAVAQQSAKIPWRPLFDGKSLTGWKQLNGKARYRVEKGVIVGSTVPNTPNSFLCTKRTYGDFILELDTKVDPTMNSGIQIRSESLPSYRKGRVHGYQVEIDPSERAWSCGIYDEARRGWLNDLKKNEPARKAFRQNEWNHYRIVCIGDSLKTWINGVPAADLVDSLTLKGFIALQVHSIGKRTETLEVRWRNLRIQDLGEHRWRPLLHGALPAGWATAGAGRWRMEGDVLVGQGPTTLLETDPRTDFTVRLQYRLTKGSAALLFRSAPGAPAPARSIALESKGDAPQELTVSAHGRRIVAHRGGTLLFDRRNDAGPLGGHLGIQLQGGPEARLEIVALELLEAAGK